MGLDIVKKPRNKSSQYKNHGPWIITTNEDSFDADLELLKEELPNAESIIDEMIDELIKHPFEGNVGQHPLWQFEAKFNDFVIWSAVITDKDRLNYAIMKDQNLIILINCYGHKVLGMEYARKTFSDNSKSNFSNYLFFPMGV